MTPLPPSPKKNHDAVLELCRSLAKDHDLAAKGSLGVAYEQRVPRDYRYTLGQYFTPPALATFLADQVRRPGIKKILDPAVGAGALLTPLTGYDCTGFDISEACLALAQATFEARGQKVVLQQQDFLAGNIAGERFDAVLANPPYLRHHFLQPQLKKALQSRLGAEFGVRLSGLSSGYLYFFLEALRCLRPGGILAFLTPADFLDAAFGVALKVILRDQLTLEDFWLLDRKSLAFEGVLTTSVVTVAKKQAPPPGHRVNFSRLTAELQPAGSRAIEQVSLAPEVAWSPYFFQPPITPSSPQVLSDYLRIRRGIATGANTFFVLTRADAERWQIPPEYLVPVLAAARDLPDNCLTETHWQNLRDGGRPCYLLWVQAPLAQLPPAVQRYLAHGQNLEVHQRFNCRTRNPWYRPENVDPPDLILTYMNRGPPRWVENQARCRVLSVFLNAYFLPSSPREAVWRYLREPRTQELLVARQKTYGGGLGKIEPRALKSLPCPLLV